LRVKNFRKIVLILLLGVIYFVFILVSDHKKIIDVLEHSNIEYILLAVFAWSISLILRGIRWHSLMLILMSVVLFAIQRALKRI